MPELNTPYRIDSTYNQGKSAVIVDCNGYHVFDLDTVDADEILRRINGVDKSIINKEAAKQLDDVSGRTAAKNYKAKYVTVVFTYFDNEGLEDIRLAMSQAPSCAWSMDHEILRVDLMNHMLDIGNTGKAHVYGSVDEVSQYQYELQREVNQ